MHLQPLNDDLYMYNCPVPEVKRFFDTVFDFHLINMDAQKSKPSPVV